MVNPSTRRTLRDAFTLAQALALGIFIAIGMVTFIVLGIGFTALALGILVYEVFGMAPEWDQFAVGAAAMFLSLSLLHESSRLVKRMLSKGRKR